MDTIVTYNGTSFDFRHLLGRAEILAEKTNAEQLPATVAKSLSLPSHRDLFLEYRRRHDSWASLEEALDEYGLDVPDPVYWDDEKVTNSRIPQLGADYLCGRAGLSPDVPVDEARGSPPGVHATRHRTPVRPRRRDGNRATATQVARESPRRRRVVKDRKPMIAERREPRGTPMASSAVPRLEIQLHALSPPDND
ncbi:hypothetical protein [Haloarcula halobia]|uniref:hypothetical protein n=1 Tax=Haloarcula halobia TaxID=3033388 RepID=UPI003AF32A9A